MATVMEIQGTHVNWMWLNTVHCTALQCVLLVTLIVYFREGVQKKYFFSSLLLLKGGGGGTDVKELLGFFINDVFVGVFQYDSGTPKHALELNRSLIFFWILTNRTEFLWSGTQGPRGRIQ